jgi:hypothetical protein
VRHSFDLHNHSLEYAYVAGSEALQGGGDRNHIRQQFLPSLPMPPGRRSDLTATAFLKQAGRVVKGIYTLESLLVEQLLLICYPFQTKGSGRNGKSSSRAASQDSEKEGSRPG